MNFTNHSDYYKIKIRREAGTITPLFGSMNYYIRLFVVMAGVAMQNEHKDDIPGTVAVFIDTSWKILRNLTALFVVVVLLHVFFKEFSTPQETYGSIWVDSPEVYTRERLVNDRFLQDAWLKKQLNETSKFVPSISYHKSQSYIKFQKEKGPVPAPSFPPAQDTANVSLSSDDNFIDLADFRDKIRNLKIENLLDDRHDLNGNTLYRLKFDATIVPGSSTKSHAIIEVSLTGPDCVNGSGTNRQSCERPAFDELGSKGSIDKLRTVYRKWLLNLQARLNQTHREQRQAYYGNGFKEVDYERLKAFFRIHYGVDAKKADDCKAFTHRRGISPHTGEGEAGKVRGEQQHIGDVGTNRIKSRYDVNHEAERACIRSLVRSIAEREIEDREKIIDALKQSKNEYPPYTTSQYPSRASGSPMARPQTPPGGDPQIGGKYTSLLPVTPTEVDEYKVLEELDKYLNTFLASKTLQLVLGIKIPKSMLKNNLYQIPQLELLSKISFFKSELQNTGYRVFVAQERVIDILAINKEELTEPSYKFLLEDPSYNFLYKDPGVTPDENIYRKERSEVSPGEMKRNLLSHFQEEPSLVKTKSQETPLLLKKFDIEWMRDESFELSRCELTEHEEYPGIYTVRAEVGLRNFAEHALKQTRTYVYAVTPKMRSDNQVTTNQRSTTVQGGISWLQDLNILMGRTERSNTINRKGTTVGFGKGRENTPIVTGAEGEDIGGGTENGNGNKEAVFGWIVGPRLTPSKGEGKVHGPVQQSLSALVSLPSWWNMARLRVSTGWIGQDGKEKTGANLSKSYDYQLNLPASYELLEVSILQMQQLGPELMESMLDPIQLTACEPGAIVIPGRRLWRSTVVTLGYQTADEISVLPNMKGIIARFDNIQNQMSTSEESDFPEEGKAFSIKRPVRIWTSQGAIALPEPALIGIPAQCRDDRVPQNLTKR